MLQSLEASRHFLLLLKEAHQHFGLYSEQNPEEKSFRKALHLISQEAYSEAMRTLSEAIEAHPSSIRCLAYALWLKLQLIKEEQSSTSETFVLSKAIHQTQEALELLLLKNPHNALVKSFWIESLILHGSPDRALDLLMDLEQKEGLSHRIKFLRSMCS